ncbi:MAG: ABC-type bacteriocin/lantibiotic exporter with double-glycine peptidase domain [Verrucomicrobiales bacterium]|jgi:ABC-type bacteriocin/lantibiotic exporter with double-glycine peptidase domain
MNESNGDSKSGMKSGGNPGSKPPHLSSEKKRVAAPGDESATVPPTFAITLQRVWKFRRYCLGFILPAIGVLLIALIQADLLLSATSTSQALLDRLASGGGNVAAPPPPPAVGISSQILGAFFGGNTPTPGTLAVLLIPLLLIAGATKVLGEQARTVLNNHLRTRIQTDLLAGFERQTGENRSINDTASALSAISQDASSVGMLLVFGVLRLVETLVQLGVYCYGLAKIPGGVFVLALIVPAAILFNGILARLFLRRENLAIRASEAARLYGHNGALELLGLLPRLVALSGEREVGEDVLERFREAGRTNARYQWISSIRSELLVALSTLTLPIVALVLISSSVTPGVIIQAQGLATLILGGITSLLTFPAMITSFGPAIDRLDTILSTPKVSPPPKNLSLLSTKASPLPLRLKNLAFSYPGSDRPVLQEINLDIPPGACIGIVGMPGCGKSTLARLLTGEWRPQSGSILYGDLDLTPLHPFHRRDLIGFLPDEPGFLTGTLADNIRFGRDLDDNAILAAADASGASRVIEEKGGLNSPITGQDPGLSGGQRRLLGIARLVAGHQPVLIFDEPGAQLSGEDIRAVAASIRRACAGRTSIIITHDPDVFQTDFNVFVQNGKIEAKGTHRELCDTNARYRELVDRELQEEQELKTMIEPQKLQ